MLIQVDVTNANGDLLSLPLTDVSQGIVVKSIDGLDPVKAQIVRSTFANQDGTQYHSARREDRNIRIKLGFEPIYGGGSVFEIRQRVYSFFVPKKTVEMVFHLSDGRLLHASGRVESCESPMFTREPEVDISIIAFSPDFVDDDLVLHSLVAQPTPTETNIVYEGTSDTGVTIAMVCDSTAITFEFRIRDESWNQQKFNVNYGTFLSGDVIRIGTHPGNKHVTRQRGSETISLLPWVQPGSVWPILKPGSNYTYLRLTVPGTWDASLSYKNLYGGL